MNSIKGTLVEVGGFLEQVTRLEEASYPADEAATSATLRYRAEKAPGLFRVLAPTGSAGPILGFVCATAAPRGTEHLTHESFSVHVENGTVVCIHSVVIDSGKRRCGLGLAMVKDYVNELRHSGQFDHVLLLSKHHLVNFYAKAGFILVGQSDVQHGKEPWYEMRLNLVP